MFGKVLFLVVVLATQGLSVTVIWLEEDNVEYIHSTDSTSRLCVAFTITKWWEDTLEQCYVVAPDGVKYEAYPNNHLPEYIMFLEAVEAFTSCSVGLRGIREEHGGTYELLSLVRHVDDTQTVTRRKYNLTVRTDHGHER